MQRYDLDGIFNASMEKIFEHFEKMPPKETKAKMLALVFAEDNEQKKNEKPMMAMQIFQFKELKVPQ